LSSDDGDLDVLDGRVDRWKGDCRDDEMFRWEGCLVEGDERGSLLKKKGMFVCLEDGLGERAWERERRGRGR